MTMNGSLVSLSDMLLGNRLFDIPVYQRSYAWETKNLEDLWEDLYYLDETKQHFFGTTLLKDSQNTTQAGTTTFRRFDVIDGQQRLTTILILLREIISQMKSVDDADIRDDVPKLESDYLKSKGYYKLNLLGNDTLFFRSFVIDDEEFPKDTQTIAQRRLIDAKLFFRAKLDGEKKRDPSNFEDFLIQLKQKIDNLQLIQYLVNSEADAIRIFETANDRGKPLSNLEKTKSFLMHTSYLGLKEDGMLANRLEELNDCFSSIYQCLEDANETKRLEWMREGEDGIQRYHFINFISPGRESSATRYMDAIRNRIRDKLRRDEADAGEVAANYALNYAKDLAQAFLSVKHIVEMPNNTENKQGSLLSKIFMLGRLGNIFPLLMTSYVKFGEQPIQMEQVLKLLEAFIFRAYVVIGRRSDAGEGWLNNLAHAVHQNKLSYEALIGNLKEASYRYGDSQRFEENLRTGSFYDNLTSREIKYLLSEYEIHLNDIAGESSVSQDAILSSKYQVEHIWPQNPDDKDKYDEDVLEQHEHNKHKLGNLTITAWNPKLSNKSFEEKKLKYKESNLRVQSELIGWSEWNPDTIKQREDAIVAWALQRWKV